MIKVIVSGNICTFICRHFAMAHPSRCIKSIEIKKTESFFNTLFKIWGAWKKFENSLNYKGNNIFLSLKSIPKYFFFLFWFLFFKFFMLTSPSWLIAWLNGTNLLLLIICHIIFPRDFLRNFVADFIDFWIKTLVRVSADHSSQLYINYLSCIKCITTPPCEQIYS